MDFWLVRKTTGIAAHSALSLSLRTSVYPSSFGRRVSLRMRSGVDDSILARASSPSAAVVTL